MREGTTLLMVPSDTPGFRVGKVFNKSGWRFYQNAELIFENARVPHANVVGEVNGGFKTRGGSFGDLELAANALGVCEAAVEMAMQHVKTPTPDGKPVIEHQVIQLKLSEMHMLTEALRSYVMRVAWEMDNAMRGSVNALLVMNFSTDVIQRVTHLNMEIHNAAGFTMDAGADKLVRDGIIWTHLAGDSVQRMKAARRLVK
jgi:alkylation response protein AidB-like acyl-CoA dehydrogenase